MHEQLRAQRPRREVVHAARPVGHIPHDHDILERGAEALQQIRDDGREEQETLGELQRGTRDRGGSDAVDGLVDLEVVVAGEAGADGLVEVRVV